VVQSLRRLRLSAVCQSYRLRADSRKRANAVFEAIRAYARNIEGPESVERGGQFNMSYYGVFFEDTFGNKFEVCHCVMRR